MTVDAPPCVSYAMTWRGARINRSVCVSCVGSCVARREWEDRSSNLGNAFDIDAVAGKTSDQLLRRAKSTYDTLAW